MFSRTLKIILVFYLDSGLLKYLHTLRVSAKALLTEEYGISLSEDFFFFITQS